MDAGGRGVAVVSGLAKGGASRLNGRGILFDCLCENNIPNLINKSININK